MSEGVVGPAGGRRWTIYVCPEHGGPLDETHCQACGRYGEECERIEVVEAAGGREKLAALRTEMCCQVCNAGPNLEPLACAYKRGHDGPHSWASLPTFVSGEVVEAAGRTVLRGVMYRCSEGCVWWPGHRSCDHPGYERFEVEVIEAAGGPPEADVERLRECLRRVELACDGSTTGMVAVSFLREALASGPPGGEGEAGG